METLDHLFIPDSKVVQDVQELIRDCESDLLFHHSSRVYHWGLSLLNVKISKLIMNYFISHVCFMILDLHNNIVAVIIVLK